MALVKELVHSHGGRVEADSGGEGRGAQFRIFLPLATPQLAVRSSTIKDRDTLAGKRILLVEDTVETLETLEVLSELLRFEGV